MKGQHNLGVSLFVAALCAAPLGATQPTALFDFDNASPAAIPGQTLPLTQSTPGGFKAEFLSLAAPGFSVQTGSTVDAPCSMLSGNFLWPTSGTDMLEVRLDRLVNSVSLSFVTLNMPPTASDVFAMGYSSTSANAAEPVAVNVGHGVYASGEKYPCGSMTLAAPHRPFDVVHIMVATGTRGIAIDDIQVTQAPCQADFDTDGAITPIISVQDIFSFLNCWFSCGMRADFNHDGTLNTQDIFDFLNAWFIGC